MAIEEGKPRKTFAENVL